MATAAVDSKAEGVVILDLRKLSFSFDFFVLCSAASDRRIQGIADDMEEQLSASGILIQHREGSPEGGWFLLDQGPVVGHIFSPELRQFYNLERLWADAPHLALPGRRVPLTRLVGPTQPRRRSAAVVRRKAAVTR